MRNLAALTALFALAFCLTPPEAEACGGFFCGQQPVDQQAERIVFAVNDDGTVTMVVQIAYQGSAPDFAWILPLAAVPDVESLDIFPQGALAALDANTGPNFQYPEDPDCYAGWELDAAAGGGPPRADGVDVHIRETVGPYDVAVIESESPAALVGWLRTNGFRVTSAMEPYIRIYTEEGMKLLALRLAPGNDTNDIEPFRFDLPGQAPSIPLRLTALAAEPEMGIAVFILGDMRYAPAGIWSEVDVDPNAIVWSPYSWPVETNWAALVARAVDDADGRGFVTEFAGPTAPYIDIIRSTTPRDEEQERAQAALLDLMEGHPYLTRMYTRLSAEEMTSDPGFRRTDGGDVDRTRMLPRYVDGRDMCDIDYGAPDAAGTTTPCDFAACGAGGLCRLVDVEGVLTAGCACIPGTTARTTFDPRGRPTVACQDRRMSFLNPGDREAPGETPLPDPCVGFDCGAGNCVAMNMTPTCVCEEGLVAVGTVTAEGLRSTRCASPTSPVPDAFYQRRLPPLPVTLPGGRVVDVPAPVAPSLGGGGGCSVGGHSATGLPLAALALIGFVGLLRRRR